LLDASFQFFLFQSHINSCEFNKFTRVCFFDIIFFFIFDIKLLGIQRYIFFYFSFYELFQSELCFNKFNSIYLRKIEQAHTIALATNLLNYLSMFLLFTLDELLRAGATSQSNSKKQPDGLTGGL